MTAPQHLRISSALVILSKRARCSKKPASRYLETTSFRQNLPSQNKSFWSFRANELFAFLLAPRPPFLQMVSQPTRGTGLRGRAGGLHHSAAPGPRDRADPAVQAEAGIRFGWFEG